jgi:predicted MFS family arabinose efflux permease
MTKDPNFTKLTDNEKASKSYFVCIPLGVGEIIGAYSTGIIADKLGMRTGSFYVSFILVSVLVISLIMINSEKFNILSYLMTFF